MWRFGNDAMKWMTDKLFSAWGQPLRGQEGPELGSEQNYTESMPEASHEEGKKKAHNADGPGGDGDDVNNGLMVVTIW